MLLLADMVTVSIDTMAVEQSKKCSRFFYSCAWHHYIYNVLLNLRQRLVSCLLNVPCLVVVLHSSPPFPLYGSSTFNPVIILLNLCLKLCQLRVSSLVKDNRQPFQDGGEQLVKCFSWKKYTCRCLKVVFFLLLLLNKKLLKVTLSMWTLEI